jgi:hypothetical protein
MILCFANPVGSVLGHGGLLVYLGKRLAEGLNASSALHASCVDVHTDALAMHRQVLDKRFAASEADKSVRVAVWAVCRWLPHLDTEVVVVIVVLDRQNGVVGQVQNVRGYSLLRDGEVSEIPCAEVG